MISHIQRNFTADCDLCCCCCYFVISLFHTHSQTDTHTHTPLRRCEEWKRKRNATDSQFTLARALSHSHLRTDRNLLIWRSKIDWVFPIGVLAGNSGSQHVRSPRFDVWVASGWGGCCVGHFAPSDKHSLISPAQTHTQRHTARLFVVAPDIVVLSLWMTNEPVYAKWNEYGIWNGIARAVHPHGLLGAGEETDGDCHVAKDGIRLSQKVLAFHPWNGWENCLNSNKPKKENKNTKRG